MQCALEKIRGGTLVKVDGDIDAACDVVLRDLAARLRSAAAPVTIDLSRVTWINSTGARHWVSFMHGAVTERTGHFELVACAVHFIDYVNLVKEMARGASISSFYVPLVCAACARETEELAKTVEVDPAAFVAKTSCSHCGGKLAPAIHWNEYVRFLEA